MVRSGLSTCAFSIELHDSRISNCIANPTCNVSERSSRIDRDVQVPGSAGAVPDDSIPATLLSRLVRDVWTPLEVKLVLAVAAMGGLREPVHEEAVLLDENLAFGARADGSSRSVVERVLESIELATARGVLLRLVDDSDEYW